MADDPRVERYAQVIWEASRADEGSISVLGAQHVARAVVAEITLERYEVAESLATALGAVNELLKGAEDKLRRVAALVAPRWRAVSYDRNALIDDVRAILGEQ